MRASSCASRVPVLLGTSALFVRRFLHYFWEPTAFCRQEQSFEVAAEPIALIVLAEEGIELLAVLLKRSRSGGNGEATSHGWFS